MTNHSRTAICRGGRWGDFFAGHLAVTDVEVVAAELVNSLVDPVLAGRRAEAAAAS
jgi:hypothetical protein